MTGALLNWLFNAVMSEREKFKLHFCLIFADEYGFKRIKQIYILVY